MATRKTAAKTAAPKEQSGSLTPEQMREAVAAIMPQVRNGMTQEQIEAMAREQFARMRG
jgi:hypothetical protein